MNQVLYGAYMEHRPPVWTPLGTKGKQKFCLWGSSSPSDVFIPVCQHVHSCLLVRVQSRQGTGWSKSRKIRRGTWALVLPEMLLWYPDTFFWWLQCPQLSKHQHGQVHTHTHTHTHRWGHTTHYNSAVSEEIASQPQLHKSSSLHTHLFSFFSCLQGRDSPLLHPELSFNPISFLSRLLRWHRGKEPAC